MIAAEDYAFTVCTATYNGAELLPRVYRCLREQTFEDFEWVVVDDGSTDETAELVLGWQAEGALALRLIQQPNRGKHWAMNRAAREARGRLFLVLDSDDVCMPHALARLDELWASIEPRQRDSFAGVTVNCVSPEGEIVGSRFPAPIIDSDAITMRDVHGVTGEKWGFVRTEVLRTFPYPEFEGERYIPLSLVWNRIGRRYRTRFADEALRVYEPGLGGLTQRSVAVRRASPRGTLLYYYECAAETRASLRWRVRAAANYARFAWHNGRFGELSRAALTQPAIAMGSAVAVPLIVRDRWAERPAKRRRPGRSA